MANVLRHYGIPGMKWGVRRYRNYDGSYTLEGRLRLPSISQHSFKTTKYRGKPVEYCSIKELNIIKQAKPLTREQHYYRNKLNGDLPKTSEEAKKLGWYPVIANAHQFTMTNTRNLKLVSPNGKMEAVYRNGRLLTNPLDMGSYNYIPSGISYRGHFIKDVLPWIKYGNAPDDPSTEFERLNSILGHYTKKAKKKGLRYFPDEVIV